MTHSSRTTTAVAIATLLTILLVDFALSQITPPHVLREVEDAVRDLERENPDTIFIGSSHGRTFHVLSEEIERRTNNRSSMVSFPVERGKLTAYLWVLEHRILPLLVETDASGRKVRDRMRRFVLVTEWWDSIAQYGGAPPSNLPGRAWHLGDYAQDVLENGITPFNRNYLLQRFRRLFAFSPMVPDRGKNQIIADLRARLRPPNEGKIERLYQQDLVGWHAQVEGGYKQLFHPPEMAALDRMLDIAKGRGWEVTILLYPRMPATLTERGKRTTLETFAKRMKSIAQERGVRYFDMTTSSPLTNEDFARDFDHVKPHGNKKFTEWALAGPLAYLLEAL